MAKSYRRLESELRRYVVGAIRDRVPFDDLIPAIDDIMRPYFDAARPEDVPVIASVVASARQQYTWMSDRLINVDDRERLARILRRSGAEVAQMGGKVNLKVAAAVRRGLSKGETIDEIENAVAHQVRKLGAAARTVAVTAASGFDRVAGFRTAREAGITRFKYAGPPGERAFCQREMALAAAGRTYTLQEMQLLNNGQGLGVDLYCGGYRCRHTWTPVLDDGPAPPPPPPVKKSDEIPVPKPDEQQGTHPKGPSVKASLLIPKSKQAASLHEALDVIAGIHGDGKLKPMPVKRTPSRQYHGSYTYRLGADNNVAITISTLSDHPMLTLAHEFGHFLDHQGVGVKGDYSSRSDAAFGKWRAAVESTAAYKELVALREVRFVERTVGGAVVRQAVSRQAVDYYLEWHELWARSYAQYIAKKSGHKEMLENVDSERNAPDPYRARHWHDDDFAPVYDEIEQLFKEQGWME